MIWNEERANDCHNYAPERLGFLGAVIGVVVGAVSGVFVDALWGVALVPVVAAGAGAAGYRVGLLAGRTWVFVDIPRHPDRGVQIRAKDEALREYWPAVWAATREM